MTGDPFDPHISVQLQSRSQFPSDLWLSEADLIHVGVNVLPNQIGKGVMVGPMKEGVPGLSSATGTLYYNAVQTSNPGEVTEFSNRKNPLYAISGHRVGRSIAGVLTQTFFERKFSTNEWVSEKEIRILGITLKPHSTPVSITLQFVDSTKAGDGQEWQREHSVDKTFYNVADVENIDVVRRCSEIYPISVCTGKRYSPHVALPLLAHTLHFKYASPFWITERNVASLSLKLLEGAQGIDLAVSRTAVLTLFNAEQTNGPQRVAAAAHKNGHRNKSAVSGSTYPELANNILTAAALKQRLTSPFWLTKGQAKKLGVDILPEQQPTDVFINENKLQLYNADQTSGRDQIELSFAEKN